MMNPMMMGQAQGMAQETVKKNNQAIRGCAALLVLSSIVFFVLGMLQYYYTAVIGRDETI